MANQYFDALIALLRAKSKITSLEKDILDTWDALNAQPFDENSARMQIKSNEINHPDIMAAVNAKPTTVQKRPESVTQIDLIYLLHSQLELLIAKEISELPNHN